MVRKRGLPMAGELVVCTITKINPNSAFARLEEYNREGMIHISEVSSGWVRDIRNFVRAGQGAIAKVLRVDERTISLSLKRVDQKQENDKLREYKLNQRAEKMLELAAKKMNKSLDEAYEEVGFLLLEKFPSMYDAFKMALQNPQLLRRRGVPEEWISRLTEIAEKNIEQKEFEFKARLSLKTYKPDGINIIKSVLKSMEKSGLEVRYIAAPNYLIKYRSMNAKKGQKEIAEKIEKSIESAKPDAIADYELAETR